MMRALVIYSGSTLKTKVFGAQYTACKRRQKKAWSYLH